MMDPQFSFASCHLVRNYRFHSDTSSELTMTGTQFAKPPLPDQQQSMPGSSAAMDPPPDYGEATYKGSGRLAGKKSIITGADSGIGRAVALAFARVS